MTRPAEVAADPVSALRPQDGSTGCRRSLRSPRGHRARGYFALVLIGAMAAGCGGGSRDANVALRRENQELKAELADLRAELAGRDVLDAATTRPAGGVGGAAIGETLFVTDRLEFGRLTGGYDDDPATPGDELLRVYVQPIDGFGDELKAAGGFTVTLLSDDADSRRLGEWTFTAAESARMFVNRFSTYGYRLDCPLDGVDYAGDVTVRVRFTESLTGKTFDAKTDATVE